MNNAFFWSLVTGFWLLGSGLCVAQHSLLEGEDEDDQIQSTTYYQKDRMKPPPADETAEESLPFIPDALRQTLDSTLKGVFSGANAVTQPILNSEEGQDGRRTVEFDPDSPKPLKVRF